MKNLLLYCLAFTSILFCGCKKTISKAQENILIQAMVNGQWKITSFVYNGNDITADFAPYKFQYFANKTVDAIKNGSTEKTGTWDGDVITRTTWANFAGATYPLSLINGSWSITDNSWTYVVATQTNGAETKAMRLEKQ